MEKKIMGEEKKPTEAIASDSVTRDESHDQCGTIDFWSWKFNPTTKTYLEVKDWLALNCPAWYCFVASSIVSAITALFSICESAVIASSYFSCIQKIQKKKASAFSDTTNCACNQESRTSKRLIAKVRPRIDLEQVSCVFFFSSISFSGYAGIFSHFLFLFHS